MGFRVSDLFRVVAQRIMKCSMKAHGVPRPETAAQEEDLTARYHKKDLLDIGCAISALSGKVNERDTAAVFDALTSKHKDPLPLITKMLEETENSLDPEDKEALSAWSSRVVFVIEFSTITGLSMTPHMMLRDTCHHGANFAIWVNSNPLETQEFSAKLYRHGPTRDTNPDHMRIKMLGAYVARPEERRQGSDDPHINDQFAAGGQVIAGTRGSDFWSQR